jgi:F5/8 type C domain/Fibronectin type III domain
MFRAVERSKSYPHLFLGIARLVSRLTHNFLGAFELSAFGLLCLLLPSSVLAEGVTLAWDPAEDPSVAGYRLYYGREKGRYEGDVDVGLDTTVTLTDLEEGQPYYFMLVAYDMDGRQGELSEEVVHNGPPEDLESDAEESGGTDTDEVDQGESDGEPVLEEADETAADELDTLPDIEQDTEDGQEHKGAEAGTQSEVIPYADLRIVSVDSETLVGDGAADLAIDGRAETFWQTARGPRASRHPHEVVLALGGEYMVRGFRYLPRQDGKTDGMVERYSFYVRQDGEDWGEAVGSGSFSRDITEQQVSFPEKAGSFVRFVAHSEVNGKPCTSVAEISRVHPD